MQVMYAPVSIKPATTRGGGTGCAAWVSARTREARTLSEMSTKAEPWVMERVRTGIAESHCDKPPGLLLFPGFFLQETVEDQTDRRRLQRHYLRYPTHYPPQHREPGHISRGALSKVSATHAETFPVLVPRSWHTSLLYTTAWEVICQSFLFAVIATTLAIRRRWSN